MISPEHSMKVALWRQKAVDGTLSLEDCREFVILCREGRMTSAAASATARRSKAIKEIPSADKLVAGLDEME